MVFYSHTIRLRTAYDTPIALYPLTETAFLANRHHITTHPFSQLKAFLCLILSFPPLSCQRPPLLPQLFMKVKCHLFILPYLLLPHSFQVNSPPLPLCYPYVVLFYLQVFIPPTKSSTLAYSLRSSLFTRYPSLLAFTNLLIGVCR